MDKASNKPSCEVAEFSFYSVRGLGLVVMNACAERLRKAEAACPYREHRLYLWHPGARILFLSGKMSRKTREGVRAMASRGWIGVDLDGTLADYHGWRGAEHIGGSDAANAFPAIIRPVAHLSLIRNHTLETNFVV